MRPDWRQIERECSGLKIRSARFLGEGWANTSYLVNGELVFRFAKPEVGWQKQYHEIQFLEFAANQLPLAVPRYSHHVPRSAVSPNGYAVYGFLSGEPLDLDGLDQRQRAAAARDLAGFLRAFHTLTPPPNAAFLQPREDPRSVAEQYRELAATRVAGQLRLSQAAALDDSFAWYLGCPSNFSFQPAVLHADLCREHILAEGGSVRAVIDFGDVSWGDPDYDFMYLFVDFGNDFVADVAAYYQHPDCADLLRKLRHFSIVEQLDTIVHGPGRALEGQIPAAWRSLRKILSN